MVAGTYRTGLEGKGVVEGEGLGVELWHLLADVEGEIN